MTTKNKQLSSATDNSQDSVATCFRCGGIFNNHFTANLLENLTVKEFWQAQLLLRYLLLRYHETCCVSWNSLKWHKSIGHMILPPFLRYQHLYSVCVFLEMFRLKVTDTFSFMYIHKVVNTCHICWWIGVRNVSNSQWSLEVIDIGVSRPL